MTNRQKMLAKAKELGLEIEINLDASRMVDSVNIDFPDLTSSPSYEASIKVPRDTFNNEPTEVFYKNILNEELATIEKEGLEPCYTYDCTQLTGYEPTIVADKDMAWLDVPQRQLTVIYHLTGDSEIIWDSATEHKWPEAVVIPEFGSAYIKHPLEYVMVCPQNADGSIAWGDDGELMWEELTASEKDLIETSLELADWESELASCKAKMAECQKYPYKPSSVLGDQWDAQAEELEKLIKETKEKRDALREQFN